MIVGIGTDIINIERIDKLYKKQGAKFASRILTKNELKDKRAKTSEFIAKRFAAKEAISKASGTGIGKLSFQDIEISNEKSGKPLAKFLPKKLSKYKIEISISDEKPYAIAFAIIVAPGES